MSDSHTITVMALGVAVEVSFTGTRAAEAVDAATLRWAHTTTKNPPARRLRLELSHDGASTAAPASTSEHPLVVTRAFTDLPTLLDSLSSMVTLAGIEERSHDLLLLHASGLANPHTGLTVASVAASGTGKTTLSRGAAGRLDYVSDETVGISADGAIARYPKPLSIKVSGGAVKEQRSPAEVGAKVAPTHGLRLARIALLTRSDNAPQTRVEKVSILDAIMELLPEISYLNRLALPLQHLASVIRATGGVVRITYAEAATAIDDLYRLTLRAPEAFEPEDAPTQKILASWKAVNSSDSREEDRLIAAHVDDILVDGDTGRAIILVGPHIMLVSAIAAFLLTRAATPATRSELRDAACSIFGAPVSEEYETQDAFDKMVEELLSRRLLRVEESNNSQK